MHTALFTSRACLGHDNGVGHPESPARLKTLLAALEEEPFSFLERRPAPRATLEQLSRVHPLDHVRRLLDAIPGEGRVDLDDDTRLSPQTGEAALHAAGAVCAAVDAVLTGEVTNAFCAVRPPGHHAERNRAMGFCLFNNLAVGAAQARTVHGLSRVAAVDFDVHHGNGTQDIFQHDPGLLFISIHQLPLWPDTGLPEERGDFGNIVNVTLPPAAGSDEFRHAVSSTVLPALDRFQPQLLMLSAGFDAHFREPMADLKLVEADYVWLTRELTALARRHCDGHIVSVLEGGYHIGALAACGAAHVYELMMG